MGSPSPSSYLLLAWGGPFHRTERGLAINVLREWKQLLVYCYAPHSAYTALYTASAQSVSPAGLWF